MHSIALAELPTSENAEGPPHDFFLSYPYLLVWTDQVDVWRFSDSSDLTHVTLLSEYVTKPSGPTPIVDHARQLLILPEPIHIGGPPRLCIFDLRDGELARDIDLPGDLADVDILYRQADGHALVLLVEDVRNPQAKTSILEVDVTGNTSNALPINLPPHLEEREKHRDRPPLVLHPIFFGTNGDIISTSTTRWLGKVDLLQWEAPSGEETRPLTKTHELLPSLEGCEAMLPTRHLAIDDSTLILCTCEAGRLATDEHTSVRALDPSTLTVRWTAKPIPGKVERMFHVPSLGVLVLSADHDVTDHGVERESLQYSTAIVVLDARTGERRAIDAVDSDVQGSWVVDCFVSASDGNDGLVVGLAWKNGDVLTVGLEEFIARGFEREGEGAGTRARTLALFPTELIAVSMGRREIVAVAGVKKHPVISEGGREEDVPDWEEEEGRVMLAKW
ncbi:hypothetical protein C8R46DRAFT_435082 [Mycena filopes]|nr:hypothetical protein C8R46DRAFT_435082 [Mycena filopes]